MVEINKWRGLQRHLNPLAVWGKALFSSIVELCATPAFQKTLLDTSLKPINCFTLQIDHFLLWEHWVVSNMSPIVPDCARSFAMERQGSIWLSTMIVSISASCRARNPVPLDYITYQGYRVQKPLDMVGSAFLSFHGRPNWYKQLRRTWWLKLSCPLAMLLHPLISRTISIKKAHWFQFFLSYELMACEVFTWLSV